jgi:hypothetical protein
LSLDDLQEAAKLAEIHTIRFFYIRYQFYILDAYLPEHYPSSSSGCLGASPSSDAPSPR